MLTEKSKLQESEVKIEKQVTVVPDTVYLTLSVPREKLLNSTVRAECALGNRVGAGYINSVKEINGERHVTVRLIIEGKVYVGTLNWDDTRFCEISESNARLEVLI